MNEDADMDPESAEAWEAFRGLVDAPGRWLDIREDWHWRHYADKLRPDFDCEAAELRIPWGPADPIPGVRLTARTSEAVDFLCLINVPVRPAPRAAIVKAGYLYVIEDMWRLNRGGRRRGRPRSPLVDAMEQARQRAQLLLDTGKVRSMRAAAREAVSAMPDANRVAPQILDSRIEALRKKLKRPDA